MVSAQGIRFATLAILASGLLAVSVQAQSAGQMPSAEALATDDPALARVRRQLEREPGLILDLPQTPTFRVTIEQRRYMLTFDEWLHKECDLNPFQRQWLEYTQKASLFTPYGVDLLQLYDRLDRLSKQLERRQAREQIARELQRLKDAKSVQDRLLLPDKQPRYSN